MDIEQLIKKIEQDYAVEKIKVNDIQVWPFLKIFFFDQLYVEGGTRVNLSILQKLSLVFSALFGIFRKTKNREYLIFTNGQQRRWINGKWTDKLMSPIATKLDKHLILEQPHFLHHHIFQRPEEKAKSNILLRLRENGMKKSSLEAAITGREILSELCNTYEVDLDVDELFRRFHAQVQLGEYLVSNNPSLKAVFVSAPYMNMGMVYALNKSGVKVVELQHGAIHKAHFGYVQYKQFDRHLFPSQIWSWGLGVKSIFDDENKMMASSNVKAIGHYYLEEIKGQFSHREDSRAIEIAVSLQDDAVGQELVGWVIQAASLNPELRFKLVRRNLPMSFYSTYSFPKNVVFSDKDVYQTILDSDVHCTVFSSCALEAPFLGVPNLMVNLKGKSKAYFEGNLNESNSRFVLSNKGLLPVIEELLHLEKKKIISSNEHNIIQGYHVNLEKAIESLKEE